MSKKEKSSGKLACFQGFAPYFIFLVLGGLLVGTCSNKLLRDHFSLDKSDVFIIVWNALNFSLCLYFFGAWLSRTQRRFYKVLVVISGIVVFLIGYVLCLVIVMFFDFYSVKLEVVDTLYKPRPDVMTVGYLTCENLKTQQIARINIQKDYSQDSEPETYQLEVKGKSYPAVLNISSRLEFTAKDRQKWIEFDTRDHTCWVHTQDKNQPFLEGFFSFDSDKDAEREERQFYGAEYEKKHPHVRTHKTTQGANP